jgi:scyllo-inositol 2-dehydrogenase (NADP+)
MINAALVSFGMSGKVFHAPFLATNPQFNLVGSWERSTKNIEAAYPGTKSYNSYEELLADADVDLVIVNSPNDTHFTYAKSALLAGKHVVVEKAFTVTAKEAEELDTLATSKGLKLAVYHNRRYDADFLTLQKLIQEGEIGTLQDVQISFERYRTTLSPKKHKESVTPGAGLLYDLGPHLVDQAILLSGMPLAVFADIRITRKVSIIDDYFTMILYYPSHRITLTSGMLFMTEGPGYKVYGTKGCFIKNRSDIQEAALIAGQLPNSPGWGAEDPADYGTLYTDMNGIITNKVIPSIPGNYGLFYDQLAEAILNNGSLPTTAAEGTNIIRVLEAARNSAFNKRVVGV